MTDLLGGQIHSVFASMPVPYSHVRAGKLRAELANWGNIIKEIGIGNQ